MTKAYSYIRFSTPEQRKGNSLDRQVALAADYAAKHGLELSTETYEDLGVSAFSGANAETGALAAFREAVEKGLIDQGSYLLVESLDRISRLNPRKAVRILEDVCDAGITVVTLSDGKAYTSESLSSDPVSFLMSILVFMRSNEESVIKSQRLLKVWASKRGKAETGNNPLTRATVAWARVTDDRAAIVAIPERVEVVQGIFRDFLAGIGAETIARELNKSGVEPWGTGGKKAKQWGNSYVKKILRNPAVTGKFTTHTLIRTSTEKKRVPQQTLDNYYPAVIDSMTFERVQELLEGKGTQGRKCSQEVKNILSFLGKCPVCGSTMTRTNKGANQYLVCVKAKSGAGCVNRNVPYDKIESAILKNIPRMLPVIETDSPERQAIRLKIAKLGRETEQRRAEINRLIGLVKSGKLENNAVVWEDDDQDEKTFRTVRDEIQMLEMFIGMTTAQITQLESEYQKSNPRIVDEKFQALLNSIKDGASMAEINASMRGIFSEAVIDYDKSRVRLKFRHRDLVLQVAWDE